MQGSQDIETKEAKQAHIEGAGKRSGHSAKTWHESERT